MGRGALAVFPAVPLERVFVGGGVSALNVAGKPGRRALVGGLGLAGLLIIVSIALLERRSPAPVPQPSGPEFDYIETRVSLPKTEGSQGPGLETHYPVQALTAYTVEPGAGPKYRLLVATYRDGQGASRKAQVYLPVADSSVVREALDGPSLDRVRGGHWNAMAAAIGRHTAEDALFVSWWDNAQRLHLYTGREIWLRSPAPEAYRSDCERTLWAAVGGGFARDGRLARLAGYLLDDADAAVASLRAELPRDKHAYLLVATDDLMRLQEMANLSGREIPLETRVFPFTGNVHGAISSVKDWAREGGGTGSYLVQPMPGQQIRAWRIVEPAFQETLLVRLFPFTSSLDRLPQGLKLVYRSDWGGYLSIYELSS